MIFIRLRALALVLSIALPLSGAKAASDVSVGDALVFPESMTALVNGTVIIGSIAKPVIFRAEPGAALATPWIDLADTGTVSIMGVIADPKNRTLWACALQARQDDPTPRRLSYLREFNLRTGKPKSSHVLPGDDSLCNDIAIASDGAAYVSDTSNGRILRLTRRGELEPWFEDERLKGVDGLAFVGPSLFVNNIRSGRIFRILVNVRGDAAGLTEIALSRPLDQPDGMRALGHRLFVVEGRGGRVAEIRTDGDSAEVVTVRDKLVTPTGVQPVGDTLWVIEGKFGYRNDPKLRGQDPGPFTALALPLPK